MTPAPDEPKPVTAESGVAGQTKKFRLLPLIVSLYIPGTLLSLGVGLVAPIIPAFVTSFGVNFAIASLAVSATAAGRVVMDIPAGMISDKVGRRRPVVASPLLVVIASVLCAYSGTFYELVAFRLLEGVGLAIWDVSRRALIVDQVPREMRGRITSTYLAFTALGITMGPVFGGFVEESFGLRAVFLTYAGLAMLSFICVFIFVKESKRTNSTKSSYGLRGWGKMFSDLGPLKLTFVVVTIGFMMSTFRQASNQTLFPLYGNFDLGLSISQIGIALGVAGGFQVLMSFGAGFISDKYGRKTAIVPSQAITGITSIALIFTKDYTTALLVMVVFGLGTGLASGNLTAITGDIAPADARGAFIGLQATLIDASQVAGPLLLGSLADSTGGFTIPFLAAGIILLASAASIQFLTVETRTYNAVRKQ